MEKRKSVNPNSSIIESKKKNRNWKTGTREHESEQRTVRKTYREEHLEKREARKRGGLKRLRWQSVFELHARHVIVQRHRDDLLHGADQAVLLAAVLDHQGVRLVGVKHDVVGGHNQHAAHHSLQRRHNT